MNIAPIFFFGLLVLGLVVVAVFIMASGARNPFDKGRCAQGLAGRRSRNARQVGSPGNDGSSYVPMMLLGGHTSDRKHDGIPDSRHSHQDSPDHSGGSGHDGGGGEGGDGGGGGGDGGGGD